MKQLVLLLKNLLDWSPRYSYLLDDSSKHNKTKGVNANVATAIIMNESQNEYKDIF